MIITSLTAKDTRSMNQNRDWHKIPFSVSQTDPGSFLSNLNKIKKFTATVTSLARPEEKRRRCLV